MTALMFEKSNPVSALASAAVPGLGAEDGARLRGQSPPTPGKRFESRVGRRTGEALRAVEWGEITARLNAARDLRLLMRTELQTNIELVAASFGDAAASYFAPLEDCEQGVNSDALGQPKALGGMLANNNATASADSAAAAVRGDARDMQ